MQPKKRKVRKILPALWAALSRKKSSRRKKKSSTKKNRLFLLLAFNALMLGFGFVWFSFQPQERQEEVRFVCKNYLARNRKISLPELASDIWNIYYGRDFVACDYAAAEALVYAGLPVRQVQSQQAGLRVLRNQGYITGYDEIRRTPLWVAYRLFDLSEEPEIGDRPDSFSLDKRSIAKVRSEEYTGSGFDRGHLAPNYAIARCYGPKAQEETFLMSNIVPQRHAFNAGVWKKLELREAVNYPGRFREIWLLAGPVFLNAPARELPSGLPVPDAFFKIIVAEQAGKIRTLAFLFDHNADENRDLNEFLCSIEEIEQLTGLIFFPELPADIQQQLAAKVSRKCW